MKRQAAKVAELTAQRDPWEPPDFLRGDARDIWIQVTDSVSADHFAEGDKACLARFCQAEARARKLANAEARAPALLVDIEKRRAHRQLVAELGQLRQQLATLTRILRLGPSTRPNAKDKRTEMPTRNPARAAKAAGDDLFKC